jgi:hypothetical protein
VATLVYNPPAQGTPHVTLINEGAAVVYVGQAAVTAMSGLPLYPKQQVSLPFAPIALYAVSGAAGTATTSNTNAAANSGATTLAFAGNYATAAVNGLQASVGTGSNAETVTISSGGGTATLTVSALQYDHRTATPVTVITPAGVSVHVEYGF